MSAPLTAYHNKVIRDHTNLDDYQFCKFLAEYTDIGEHFYLDKIVKGKDGDFYFIGGCLATSDNLKYHALARRGEAFDDFIIFKDGGLNTLGHAEILSILSNLSTAYDDDFLTYKPRLNNTVAWANFKSAYYLDSSEMRIEIKNELNNFVPIKVIGGLAEKLSWNDKTTVIESDVINVIGSKTFRATIENPEGIFNSNEITATIYRGYAVMKFNPDYASYAYNGSTTREIYYDTRELQTVQDGTGLVTSFSKNDVLEMISSDIADGGFYIKDGKWYEWDYYVPDDDYRLIRSGFCTKWGWPTDDPNYQYNPEFYTNIQTEFSEATLSVTSSTLTLTPGDDDISKTPPEFPDASYDLTINCSIALTNKTVYFYILTSSMIPYLIGSDTTGFGSTKQFNLSGTFDSIGLTPKAGESFYIQIKDY
jgi:hypothetical protein